MGKISIDELRRRLELALRLAEPPTVEEVLAAVEKNGKLRGPVDWVFKAWRLYVDYVVKEIIDRFKPSAEEEDQLRDFGRKLNTLLERAERQAKAKLAMIYNAIVNNIYRIEGKRLYTPHGVWMYVREDFAPYILIHGISASTRFPDVLKLPREKLELFQLGWRASDEGSHHNKPYMSTAQPWQVFSWVATRYGVLHMNIDSVSLTYEGASVSVRIKAKDWRQMWAKAEAIDLVMSHFKLGVWAPLFTMWLGDGEAGKKRVLRSKYELVVAAKEPWKLGLPISTEEALVATGKEAFVKLREAADIYGKLLDILRIHKWIEIKLATDDTFRAAYKLRTRRGIDLLRETYRQNGVETSAGLLGRGNGRRRGGVVVAGVEMSLHLVNGTGGSLRAERYTRDLGKAFTIAGRLESAGLRPNVVRSGPKYVVYIAMADLLRLAERDGEIRRAMALYLAEKAKNGTPRQRELAEKILQRHPFLSTVESPHTGINCEDGQDRAPDLVQHFHPRAIGSASRRGLRRGRAGRRRC